MKTTKNPTAPAAKVRIHKSIDPTWPRWAVVGKTTDTKWFKTLAESEAFAGFKYEPPKAMITIPLDKYAALVESATRLANAVTTFPIESKLLAELRSDVRESLANLAVRDGKVVQP